MSKTDDTNPIEDDEAEAEQPHAFWSGIIAFGLVSLPVSLFPAHRGKVALKMVDADGNPLRREFYCEHDNRPLDREDIVRSYEIEKYHYVVVEDEELEALEPKRSREIDLKRFVPVSEINPVWFKRAYFLVPDGDTTKAYRLLAKSMEEGERAGIATFVMHGKDYLVAIIAKGGILRAETLHFHDELRTLGAIGLPPRQHVDKKSVERMRAAIRKSTHRQFEAGQLSDPDTHTLMELIEAKRKAGIDVLPAPAEPESVAPESNVIDLVQILRERLQEGRTQPPPVKARSTRKARQPRNPPIRSPRRSMRDLYQQARALQIPGRSRMSRHQLIAAIARAKT